MPTASYETVWHKAVLHARAWCWSSCGSAQHGTVRPDTAWHVMVLLLAWLDVTRSGELCRDAAGRNQKWRSGRDTTWVGQTAAAAETDGVDR